MGACLGYNPTIAPPVKVNSARRVVSVPNSKQVKIKPPTCSPVKKVDDNVPSKSLSNFPTPIYNRRRWAPFTPRIPIYEFLTTRRKLSQNYFCDLRCGNHQECMLNFCVCGTTAAGHPSFMMTTLRLTDLYFALFAIVFKPMLPSRMVLTTQKCVHQTTCIVTVLKTMAGYLYLRLVNMVFLLCVFSAIFSISGNANGISWKLVWFVKNWRQRQLMRLLLCLKNRKFRQAGLITVVGCS
jgi:hypothetical protein